jgi:hypothetical protein
VWGFDSRFLVQNRWCFCWRDECYGVHESWANAREPWVPVREPWVCAGSGICISVGVRVFSLVSARGRYSRQSRCGTTEEGSGTGLYRVVANGQAEAAWPCMARGGSCGGRASGGKAGRRAERRRIVKSARWAFFGLLTEARPLCALEACLSSAVMSLRVPELDDGATRMRNLCARVRAMPRPPPS